MAISKLSSQYLNLQHAWEFNVVHWLWFIYYTQFNTKDSTQHWASSWLPTGQHSGEFGSSWERNKDTRSASDFLKAAALYFNIWERSRNSSCFQPGDWGVDTEELLCILSMGTSTQSSCFAFFFSIKLFYLHLCRGNKSHSKWKWHKTLEINSNVPKGPPCLWWDIKKVNFHWYQRKLSLIRH